jgi:hypothetical protein
VSGGELLFQVVKYEKMDNQLPKLDECLEIPGEHEVLNGVALLKLNACKKCIDKLERNRCQVRHEKCGHPTHKYP